MTDISSVCVYCGSAAGAHPAYAEAAATLGRDMARAGLRLVYGGGSIGLMGLVARHVMEAGGRVTGIIPEFLKQREQMLDEAHELLVTENMHQRKQAMFDRSDAFVALPGGVGTLEELVEMMTWAQLGRHQKPVLIANVEGFWDPLVALLRHMDREGFIRPGFEVGYVVVERAEDIVPTLLDMTATRQRQAEPAAAIPIEGL